MTEPKKSGSKRLLPNGEPEPPSKEWEVYESSEHDHLTSKLEADDQALSEETPKAVESAVDVRST